MDVGNPSNFVRILELFHHKLGDLRTVLTGYSISDDETREVMKEVYQQYKYLPDPHGAVGYLALQRYLQQHAGEKGMFLETAHPVKFYDVVEPIIGQKAPMPAIVNDLLKLKKQSIKMDVTYENFRDYLLSK
jgi:threonine synthase